MSVFSRLFRHSPWRYLIAAGLGAVVTLLSLARSGFDYLLAYVDALTAAGAVVALAGLLGLVSHFGAFDLFGYSFSTLGRRRYDSLFAYSQAKQEKRSHSGWTFMPFITVGAVFITVGAVFLLCGAALMLFR